MAQTGKSMPNSKLNKAYKTAKQAQAIYNLDSASGFKLSKIIRAIGGQSAVNKVDDFLSKGRQNTRNSYAKAGGKFTPRGGLATPRHSLANKNSKVNTRGDSLTEEIISGAKKATKRK